MGPGLPKFAWFHVLTVATPSVILTSMRSRSEHDLKRAAEASRELAVLSEVRQTPDVTQRELAARVGLSLGATNLLLQNLVRKGYLRIKKAGWRRWLYALTPSGVARRVALTTGYVDRFLDQYRQVRSYIGEHLGPAAQNGRRVAVYGSGDIVRLVHLVLEEVGSEDIDVFVPDGEIGSLPGLEVQELSVLAPDRYDRIVVAAVEDADVRSTELRKASVPPEMIEMLFQVGRGR